MTSSIEAIVTPAALGAPAAPATPATLAAETAPAAPAAQDAWAAPAFPPPLPPPPDEIGLVGALSRASRAAFHYANRCAMVPFHRAGLAAWLGNPLTGWQLLLTTTGRKSGLRRPTPLGYLVEDGAAWVLAGYGPSTLWYRNLVANPAVEVLLPARPPFAAQATDILDPAVRARIIPLLVRSMALPGALIGDLPWRASDERILELTAWVPLIRLSPADGSTLEAGTDDPGGLGWTWRTLAATLVTAAAWRALRSCRRR
ncbi:MAG TPA: nitroreductase family deazaflavin-dependent oxidoreductase [Candidatus Limnocylindrales bacterium]